MAPPAATKPSTAAPAKPVYRTRDALQSMRVNGDVWGYFGDIKKAADEQNTAIANLSLEMVVPPMLTLQRPPLLDTNKLEFLVSAVQYRDQSNNGTSRNKILSLMMEMKQTASNRKKCDDHYTYLVKANKMPALKCGGRVVRAQATTAKRSQILAEQQLRWHTTVESAAKVWQTHGTVFDDGLVSFRFQWSHFAPPLPGTSSSTTTKKR
jgi:hypothetical protein